MVLKTIDKLTHSTIRIELFNEFGQPNGTGTGFFFVFRLDEKTSLQALITNKHVVKQSKSANLVFTIKDNEGNPDYGNKLTYTVDNFEESFIMHPDEKVDLCVLPIQDIINDAYTKYNKKLYISLLGESLIPKAEEIDKLNVMEDVIMIGYPNGLWEENNNLPIVRRGITSIHPKFNYNGGTNIVVDMACFPGSSGSPILIHNQGSYPLDDDIVIGNRTMLLGVLHSGPTMSIEGEIIIQDIPTSSKSFSRSNLMINIGYAAKSSRILDFKSILIDMINSK